MVTVIVLALGYKYNYLITTEGIVTSTKRINLYEQHQVDID